MASREQLRRLRNTMHKLRIKAFDTTDIVSLAKGPSKVEIGRLTQHDIVQWKRTARAILDLDPDWNQSIAAGCNMMAGGETSTLVLCECCLTTSEVTLARPTNGIGLLSQHQDGDWICAKCDPRVGTWIDIFKLSNLVSKESS